MRSGSAQNKFSRQSHVRLIQTGYTLLMLLAVVALVAIGMYRVSGLVSTQRQREQEQMLLRVGNLYAQALQHYRASAVGSQQQYPTELNQLVLDSRFVSVIRHLRQLYPDPMQPTGSWGLIRNSAGGITGVYSTSDLRPFLQNADAPTAGAQHYSDWKFMAKGAP